MSERFAWLFDKNKQKKVWVADMWARKAVLAIRTAITGITSRLTTIENAGYQTGSDVSAAIAAAIGGITELEYLVVSTLPPTGSKGVIYLVPHQHGTRDIYDEYIWVNNAFEKIGSTDVDLSQYLLKTDISAWAKASTKPTYTASEVGALPDDTVIPTVPTKVSAFQNDAGYLTSYTETDPTVPSWAKQSTKPSYTAAEVGALPNTTHIPTKTSDLTNDSGFITGYTETDPTVPAWAKAATKPSYTASEVLTVAQLAAVNSGITADDLAVDDASAICTVTPTEPTLTSGAHYDTFGRCWYYKIGHRVRVHIGVSGLTANTTTTLWTMPTGYRPYSSVSFTGQSSSYSNIARCRVLENGEVRVSAASTYATAYCEYDAFE